MGSMPLRKCSVTERFFTRNADPGALITRALPLRPNGFDATARTFMGAVIATSAPVRRRSYTETLDLNGARLGESLPLVVDHRTDVRSLVGRVGNLRVQGSEMLGDGRLSSDQSLAWLVERIGDGTASGLSIGFTVERWRDDGSNGRTAVEWTPRHCAIVADPADDRARIRSSSSDDADLGFEGSDGRDGVPGPSEHRARIRSLARALGLARRIEDQALDENWSDAELMDAVIARGRPRFSSTRHETLDDPEIYRSAMRDALVARTLGTEAQGPARELASLSWADLHRRHLREHGQGASGQSDAAVIHRALSTSDLPLLAGEAVGVAIRRTYEAQASPITALFGTRELPDFRVFRDALVDWTTLSLDKVNELGEYKSSYVTESGEEYRLYTIGGITGISRQVWINGPAALSNLSMAHGRRLAADTSDRAVRFLEQNAGGGPVLRDGSPMFAASRPNILPLDTALPGVIDALMRARTLAARRRGAGDVQIGQMPTVWLLPPEAEGMAIRALATVAAVEVANVNPLSGRLQITVEPRLSNPDRSYLLAPPSAMEGLVRLGLVGSGVMTDSRWGFEVDAVQFKIRLDLGFGVADWRAWSRLDHSEAA